MIPCHKRTGRTSGTQRVLGPQDWRLLGGRNWLRFPPSGLEAARWPELATFPALAASRRRPAGTLPLLNGRPSAPAPPRIRAPAHRHALATVLLTAARRIFSSAATGSSFAAFRMTMRERCPAARGGGRAAALSRSPRCSEGVGSRSADAATTLGPYP